MLDVERWAEPRREHFVRRVAIKELARRYGIDIHACPSGEVGHIESISGV